MIKELTEEEYKELLLKESEKNKSNSLKDSDIYQELVKSHQKEVTPILKTIFKGGRVVGLAGNKSSGKSNNVAYMIKQYRELGGQAPIYVYGFPQEAMEYLNSLGVHEIDSIEQLGTKKDCLIFIDEFQRLKLNDWRHKDELSEFINFLYHRNVYVMFISPDIREFNSIIGGVIETWLLKNISVHQAINGSQLKKVIEGYKGRYKSLGTIHIDKGKLLLINSEKSIVIHCDYVKEVDGKKNQKELF